MPDNTERTERKGTKTRKSETDNDKRQPAGVVREGGIAASIWKTAVALGLCLLRLLVILLVEVAIERQN
jgi:hypothetical protein